MNPTRRDFLALGVGALAVATLPRAARPRRLVRRQVPVMGTLAEVAVRHRDERWAQRAIDAALAELHRVDRTMTRFRPDSDVGVLNASAGGGAVAVAEDTRAVLARSLAWAAGSEGRFDPCLGRASVLWDAEGRRTLPEDGEVRHLAGGGLWHALEVDASGTVRLQDPRAAVDLGGIAKGFGVDAAARALQDHGVFHALVNVGGDLVALGTDEHDEPWRVGIRSPHSAAEIVHVLEVSDGAVATSGDYLRYFEHGGRRYHHLLDPETAAPRRTAMRSLTVTARRCVDADAAATALFGAPAEVSDRVLSLMAADARVAHTL